MKKLDQSVIRRRHLQRILALLNETPGMTRQQLCDAAGVTLMTITNLIDFLKEQNVLAFTPVDREAISGRRTPGRIAERIFLTGANHAFLIVDLSGSNPRYWLTGFDMAILKSGSYSCETDSEEPLRLKAFLSALRATLPSLLGGRELLGVSVITPGPYDPGSDTISNQRLPVLNGLPIRTFFGEALGNHHYHIDEDVKYAVNSLGDAASGEVLYFLHIGEGVGGAAITGDRTLRGLNGAAGDAGQLRDHTGCTYEERLCTGAFLGALHSESAADAHTLLCHIAQQQPEAYKTALKRFAARTADLLYSVIWMLDPAKIIIDCQYAPPFGDDYIASITEALKNRFCGMPRLLPALALSQEGMGAALRGAVQALQREWIERIVL